MTFANAAEKVRDGESGHLQVAITDLGKVPAERLHPKAAYSRCRPMAARRASPKLPDGSALAFAVRVYEAAVRQLRQPTISNPPVNLWTDMY